MKSIEQINLEAKNIPGMETFINKKEFLELSNLLNESEIILDVVCCTKVRPSATGGILVTTNNKLFFLSHSVLKGIKKNEFHFSNILRIKQSKGIIFSKIGLKYENTEIEFDYILNKYFQHTVQQIERRMKLVNEEIIKEKLLQENNVNLTPLEKIKFKKFIGEQGGMNISEVEHFLNVTPQVEVNEIIVDFKKSLTSFLKEDISNLKNSNVLHTQVIKVINEDSTLPTCPKCKSKQVNLGKQGFGVGKAFVGAVLTGGIGLLAGGINKNKLILTCLNCGNTWTK